MVPFWQVEAVAYDNPIPGHGTRNTITLRLWAAKPSDQIDMVILIKLNIYPSYVSFDFTVKTCDIFWCRSIDRKRILT